MPLFSFELVFTLCNPVFVIITGYAYTSVLFYANYTSSLHLCDRDGCHA